MKRIGDIFCSVQGVHVVLGTLAYDERVHHAMLGMDVAALVPACRACRDATLNAACIPGPGEWPYLQADLQITAGRKKRVKMGFVWTQDDAHGHTIFQVRVDIAAVMKRLSMSWWHVHELTEAELTGIEAKAGTASEPRPEQTERKDG